jgi:hypothetical protein
LELRATYSTEKSSLTKAYTRQANAIATNTNCPVTAGRATAIQTGLAAPRAGNPKNACDRLSTEGQDEREYPEFRCHDVSA